MPRSVVLVIGLVLVAAGCGRKDPPATTPTPIGTTPVNVNSDSIAAARRADSIAAAEAEARRLAAAAEASRAALINELASMIHFDYDQFNVRSSDEQLVARKVAIMRANPALRVRIVGHADERGSDEYNLALGMRRAVAVKDFMVRMGVDAGRIDVASLGEERPMDVGSNEAAWAMNRRGEFEIVAGGQNIVAPGN